MGHGPKIFFEVDRAPRAGAPSGSRPDDSRLGRLGVRCSSQSGLSGGTHRHGGRNYNLKDSDSGALLTLVRACCAVTVPVTACNGSGDFVPGRYRTSSKSPPPPSPTSKVFLFRVKLFLGRSGLYPGGRALSRPGSQCGPGRGPGPRRHATVTVTQPAPGHARRYSSCHWITELPGIRLTVMYLK